MEALSGAHAATTPMDIVSRNESHSYSHTELCILLIHALMQPKNAYGSFKNGANIQKPLRYAFSSQRIIKWGDLTVKDTSISADGVTGGTLAAICI